MQITSSITIRAPETPVEFASYYELRRRALSRPLGQKIAQDCHDASSNCWHYVAILGDVITGVARLHRTKNNHYVVSWVAVDPNLRHHGIGRTMMEAIEQDTIRRGGNAVELTSRYTARKFFGKLGYETVGKAPSLENHGPFKIDTRQVFMRKGLS